MLFFKVVYKMQHLKIFRVDVLFEIVVLSPIHITKVLDDSSPMKDHLKGNDKLFR